MAGVSTEGEMKTLNSRLTSKAMSTASREGGALIVGLDDDEQARAGCVERYLNVELPVAAHRERARAAPRGTELHEPRGDSRLLLGARNPLPDHGGVRGRQGEGHEGHRSKADRAGPCPALSRNRPSRSAHPHPRTDCPRGESAGAARTSRSSLLSLVCEGVRGCHAAAS